VTVAGDITVQSGETLFIQPGVLVLFTGRYKFTVSGLPDAKGTESDTIIFTRAEPTELSNWRGFRFDGACDAGGGICSRYDTSEINNNTILGNQMNRGGGVYVLTYSYLPPVICNTILWDNSASTDPEIHLDPTPGSNAVVTFGDISGGWSVQGNIDEDPLFTSLPLPAVTTIPSPGFLHVSTEVILPMTFPAEAPALSTLVRSSSGRGRTATGYRYR